MAQLAARLAEASRLGFKRAMIPAGEMAVAVNLAVETERAQEEKQGVVQSVPAGRGTPPKQSAGPAPLELLPVRRIDEALDWLNR